MGVPYHGGHSELILSKEISYFVISGDTYIWTPFNRDFEL